MFLPVGVSRGFHRADDLVRRRGVWAAYRSLRRSDAFSAQELADLQATKLRALIQRAATNSPYWRRVFEDRSVAAATIRSPEDLSRLPTLTREVLRREADTIRSSSARRGSLLPNSTGGSTGSNVKFWVDRECWRWRDAATLRMWDTCGLRAGIPLVQVWGSPMDQTWARTLRQRVRFFLDNRRLVSAYAVDDESLAAIARRVTADRPQAIMGYASVLDLLATKVRTGKVPWRAARDLVVVSASETLFPEQRRNIAESLGARVVNLYGCREFGLLAIECSHGGMHLVEERFIVELMPEQHGQGSRVVVTDLDNGGFPFIRYEIGDLADPDPTPCPCGRAHRKLANVRGRTFDVIKGPNGRAVGGTFWSLLLRTAVEGIETWQVVQRTPRLLEIRSTPRGGLDDAGRRTVREQVSKALGEDLEVEFREEDRLDPLPSGKHRFIVALRDEQSEGTGGAHA